MKRISLFLAFLFLFISCEPSGLLERQKRANKSSRDIIIAVVQTSSDNSFLIEGVSMAVEEINNEGGTLGRKIKTIIYDDKGSIVEGFKIARKVADNYDVVAVIGHMHSDVAVSTALTYDKNGIIFISPGATHPKLTRYGGEFVFRNISSDEEIAISVAKFLFLYKQDKKKIGICYERDAGTIGYNEVKEVFAENMTNLGGEIMFSRSFLPWQSDFRTMLSEIKKGYNFDSLFIAGSLYSSSNLIKQAREMGIDAEFIGIYTLDSHEFISIAKEAAEATIIPTVFNPHRLSRTTRDFVDRFKSKYHVLPDTWAAQGYDAVKLIAYALKKGGTTNPNILSNSIRYIKGWDGVTGSYSFTQNGDIENKSIYFKKVQNEDFVFLRRQFSETDDEGVDIVNYSKDSTLRLALKEDIKTIDPGLIKEPNEKEIAEQLFLGLTQFGRNKEVIPEIAESWIASQDIKTFHFKLRKDVKWSNDKPVTSNDLVYAIRRNINPEMKSPYAKKLYILKNGEAINKGHIKDRTQIGVRAIDDYTVEFNLENSAPYFPELVSLPVFWPQPADVIEKYGDMWANVENIKNNGAYSIAIWKKGVTIVLKANPYYYNSSNLAIPEVRYSVVPSEDVAFAMYQNNELDIIGGSYLNIPKEKIPDIKYDPILSTQYRHVTLPCTYSYGFNTKLFPVDNILVRKAISSAISKKLLLDLLKKKGIFEVADTFTHNSFFEGFSTKKIESINFNPIQAKKWLKEAGYPDGKGFPEIMILCKESKNDIEIADGIKEFLKHILNINVSLITSSEDNFNEERQNKKTHMFQFEWCAEYLSEESWLLDADIPKLTSWDNTYFSQIIDKATKEINETERDKLFRRAEEILNGEESVIIPIFFYGTNWLVKNRVSDWYAMPIGGQHINNWSLLLSE
ncbi:MAG: ABC transporter substrate-binding protein [Desulfobacterales bacterium]|nr:ABC transporter substrate-binding protein [Desulfobacterales bacterium]